MSDASWDELTDRQVRLARERGALSVLPIALVERFGVQLFLGDLGAAQLLVTEAEAVVEASGSHLAPQGAIALAAWRGAEREVSRLIEASRDEVVRRGEGLWLIATGWASAVLFNSLGRYEEALAVAEQAGEDSQELGVSTWYRPSSSRPPCGPASQSAPRHASDGSRRSAMRAGPTGLWGWRRARVRC